MNELNSPVHYVLMRQVFVNTQPFPTSGPLDKYCLGLRTQISTIKKISEFLTTFLVIFPKNFLGSQTTKRNSANFLRKISEFLTTCVVILTYIFSRFSDHQKEFRQFSQFPCIFQSQGQKKTFQFPFAD